MFNKNLTFKKIFVIIYMLRKYKRKNKILRGRAEVACQPHKLEVGGSNPPHRNHRIFNPINRSFLYKTYNPRSLSYVNNLL